MVTLPGDAAGRRGEVAVGIQIGDAGDVVRLQRPSGDAAGRERDRKHDRFGGEHAAAAALTQLGLAERRVAQPAQMADLVQRDAFQVESARLRRPAPTDHGNAELKKMSDSTSAPVDAIDEEARRGQHAIQSGRLRNPSVDSAVVVAGQAGGQSGELIGDRRDVGTACHVRERAADGGLEIVDGARREPRCVGLTK